MSPFILVGVLLAVGVAVLTEALDRSDGDGSTPRTPEVDRAVYATATQVFFSCGGGFTGASTGRTVHRDGTVEDWTFDPTGEGDETIATSFRAAPDDVAALFALVERLGFLDQPAGTPANYGCILTLTAPTLVHSVTWEDTVAPASMAPLVEAIRRIEPAAR
ncbi:MAG: hypothetical protein ACYTG6_08745 [Planctomycetota bacterium]